jgi:pimeloyl-ACP methyl ester carboxylesterase
MRRALLSVACGLTVCCGAAGPIVTRIKARPAAPTVAVEPGEHRLALGTPTTRRDGILYVPRSAVSHPVPLLVLLHGGGGRANYFRFTFPLAEEAGVSHKPDMLLSWRDQVAAARRDRVTLSVRGRRSTGDRPVQECRRDA